MTFMFMLAECHRCRQMFQSNPALVPTVRDSAGVKQPMCASCVRVIQALQVSMGLAPWPDPLPGAYAPVDLDATEMDYD